MAIKVSYYGSKKPGPSVKPDRVVKLPDNVPRDKLPFGQHNPIDWMTGKHLFRLRNEDRDKSRNGQSSEADDDRYIFPVDLVKVEGEGGSVQAPATWKYDVRDIESGALLLAGVNPTAAPHQWRRPEVGAMKPATYGYAYFDDGDDGSDKMVVLGWINEAPAGESEGDDPGSGDDVPPPCGHPGNEPGAGGDSGGGDDTEHPGDESGAGGDSGGGDDTDHPGDSPSPPSGGECP